MSYKKEYDRSDAISIYEYSKQLIGHSLNSWSQQITNLVMDEGLGYKAKNKGDLGQNVERIFFKYDPNSSKKADFEEANLELKCTGLRESYNKRGELKYLIKERLVCDIINYIKDVDLEFEKSHFFVKCSRMLILFYLYQKDIGMLDLVFLKSVLWKLPKKDLLIIRQDYETIIQKIKTGNAHLISESDTMYLAACRKGNGGEKDLRPQPYSDIKAYQRAFSLKPSYMRTVLQYVIEKGADFATNFYEEGEIPQLVSQDDLEVSSFFDVILSRFRNFYGKNYHELREVLLFKESGAKQKYALAANAIISPRNSIKDTDRYDEFKKSGITVKTVRMNYNGSIDECMSFENIDYVEIFENDVWEDSRLYEIFTTKFLFVVYKEAQENSSIIIAGKEEKEYKLYKAFFWSMPSSDLEEARLYWENIRKNVMNNTIELNRFYKIADHKKFHVRPKGTKQSYHLAAENPNGGKADKFCYWFNSEYVKSIINNQEEKIA